MKTNLINVWIYLWFLKDLWFPYIVLSWNAADTDNALTFFLVQARHFTPPPPPVCNSIQEIWHWRKFSLACLYNTESWWCWLCRVAEILVHKLCFRNCFLLSLSLVSLSLSDWNIIASSLSLVKIGYATGLFLTWRRFRTSRFRNQCFPTKK